MTITRDFSKSIVASCREKAKAEKKANPIVRPTAKNYRKQLKDLEQQQIALKNRITKRAIDLCKRNPDVIAFKHNASCKDCDITAKQYGASLETGKNESSTYIILSVIETIEAELANKQPYKQGTIKGF